MKWFKKKSETTENKIFEEPYFTFEQSSLIHRHIHEKLHEIINSSDVRHYFMKVAEVNYLNPICKRISDLENENIKLLMKIGALERYLNIEYQPNEIKEVTAHYKIRKGDF